MKWRKWHRWVALATLLPLIMIAVTGVILQLRNQFEFIQPSVLKNVLDDERPLLSLEEVLKKYQDQGVEQIIFRPSKGAMAVRLQGGSEVQIHPQTGEELKQAMRRTGFLIDLHQGSWLGSFGQYGLHLLGGWGLIFLLVSGIIIYPFRRKRI